ncbi:MAG: alpha/beta hydrolase [Dehalococcoidia bacterium]|jgi:pimeloyl-ACP methyl ester carboxylesterase
MPYAQVNDISMFYTDEGDGPPVLMVHGWSCDGSDWSWQTPALKAAGYRCIVPDLRGHGRTTVTEDGYTPKNYSHDLAELLRQLGTGPVVAIGHSMGGATVVALAVEHPECVRAVVPVDSAYGFTPEVPEAIRGMVAAFRGPGGHEAALQFAGAAFYGEATPAHLPALHARRIAAFDQEVMWKAMAGLALADDEFGTKPKSEAYLSRVQAPALAFRAGNQDPAATAAWERAQFKHPASRAVGWEGTGHWLHQERPAEFNSLLLSWLAGLG